MMRTLNPAPLIRRTWARLKRNLVQEVPEELAVCEFGCRKTHCTMAQWATCRYRLQGGLIPQQKAQAESEVTDKKPGTEDGQ